MFGASIKIEIASSDPTLKRKSTEPEKTLMPKRQKVTMPTRQAPKVSPAPVVDLTDEDDVEIDLESFDRQIKELKSKFDRIHSMNTNTQKEIGRNENEISSLRKACELIANYIVFSWVNSNSSKNRKF